ncbi:hypothetical protein V6N13_143237 [Hibiscus sabdariffa]
MDSKPPKRSVIDNGETGEDLVRATLIGNGDDLGPLVRHAFEMGRPKPPVQQLKHLMKKKWRLRTSARFTRRNSFVWLTSFGASWSTPKSLKVFSPAIISGCRRWGVLCCSNLKSFLNLTPSRK